MRNSKRGIGRALVPVAAGIALAGLAGCAGGSSSSSSSISSSSSSGQQGIASPAANVVSMVVDCGPSSICSSSNAAVDEAFVTVTVCPPGSTTNCQTFDHIQVDTQSYGLRILADATDTNGSTLSTTYYPPEIETTHNLPLAECTVFADGYSWGPVVIADVQISGESASGVPIQIIGDMNAPYSTIPADCSSSGASAEDTVSSFGANGILGVGVFVADCGTGCQTGAYSPTYYYVCSSGTCADSTVEQSQQVSNPVPSFQSDNNGVIVELPSIPSTGASTATGALVFGIDTEGNNGLGAATVFQADPGIGTITTDYNGQTLSSSLLDSGSNGLYFADSSITQCTGQLAGFYCPNPALSLSATISGASGSPSGTSSTVDFSVGDAATLNGNFAAFDNLAGPLSSGLSSGGGVFDWGLPFFFGRDVYVAIDGANTSAGAGPYFAF
jgi:Protein of unknown function (DUF3443)